MNKQLTISCACLCLTLTASVYVHVVSESKTELRLCTWDSSKIQVDRISAIHRGKPT